MNPTPGDVHVNKPLTNISVAFLQKAEAFVADKVFPNISVQHQGDRYYTYDRGHFNRDEMKERAPGTESAGGDYELDNTPTYWCPVYAFHHDIPDQRRANSDGMLDPDREATELVTHKALIKREKTWVAKYFVGGVWTGGDVDGVAAAPGGGQVLQWSDANSDPIGNIRGAITAVEESTGFTPNTLVIGKRVLDVLIDHPDIIERVKYGTQSNVAMVDVAELKALLKIERIFVMRAVENTAKEGLTNAHSFIGGKKALLCYSAPSPGLMTPTAGYTFSWTGFMGAAAQGQRIKRFRMENLESDRVEVQMSFDQKLVASDLGYFWDTIVA